MALNTARLTRSKEEARGGGGSSFKLKEGRNKLRFFKFSHKVTQHDFDVGLVHARDGSKVGQVEEFLDYMTVVHFVERQAVPCLRKDCPQCAKAEEYAGATTAADKEIYRNLRAVKQFYINCLDMEDAEGEMKLVQMPPSVFQEILGTITDPDFGEKVLGHKGRDFSITKNTAKGTAPKDMYKVKLLDADKSEKLDAAFDKDTRDLFLLPPPGALTSDHEKGNAPDPRATPPSGRRAPAGLEDDAPDPASHTPEVENDLPWEKGSKDTAAEPPRRRAAGSESAPSFIKVGGKIEFQGDGKSLLGTIVEINEGKKVADVQVEGDPMLWEVDFADMKEAVEAEAPRRRKAR